jgi:peptide/nickel transport system permease protein
MIMFLLRRIVTMAVTLLIISALVFFIIKLPPGDFLTNQISELRAQGEAAAAAKAEFLIKQYGLRPGPPGSITPRLDRGLAGPERLSGLLQGDWGWSFEFDKPGHGRGGRRGLAHPPRQPRGRDLIHVVSTRSRSIPRRGSIPSGDYAATFVGYIGLATPRLPDLAQVLLYYSNRGSEVIRSAGSYDPQYAISLAWPNDHRSLLSHSSCDPCNRALGHRGHDPAHAREPSSTSSASSTS